MCPVVTEKTTPKMNPEVKAKWVAALRSGDYEQGRHRLHCKDGKFCCLGVLCDLAVKNGVIPEPEGWGPAYYYGSSVVSRSDVSIPIAVSEWAGLTGSSRHNPRVEIAPGSTSTLANLNDSGTPFERIAQVIEEKL
jgi:hypothetical protein